MPTSPISTDATIESLAEAVHHLTTLHNHLANAAYASFWSTLDSDDLYADLVADVHGFEELMRVRIAVVVSQCMQEVDREVLEAWLNLRGAKFENFVREVCGCGWTRTRSGCWCR